MHLFYIFNILLSILLLANSNKIFNDLLTNDNELLLLDTQTSSRKAGSSSRQNLFEDTTVKSKIVVDILYKSKSNKDFRNESASIPNKTQKAIIYFNSNKLTSCDKNVCKPDESCILKQTTISQKDTKDYNCIPKTKKQINQKKSILVANKNKTNTINKKSYNNSSTLRQSQKACSSQTLSNLKITLFEILQRNTNEYSYRKEMISKWSNKLCLKTVLNSFAKLDFNMDLKLSLQEWFKLEVTSLDNCAVEFFRKCDSSQDQKLSVEELCSCFDGAQHKCSYIRNSASAAEINNYAKSVENVFVGKLKTKLQLTNRNYIPICDSDGYFSPLQCDKQINCWCVDKQGNPIVNTFRKIDQDPVICFNQKI